MWIYRDTGVHSRVLSLLWFCTNFAEGSVAFLELLYAFSLLEFLKKWDLPLPIYPLQNSAGYPGEQVLWHSWWPHSVSVIPGGWHAISIVLIAGDYDEHYSLSGHVVLSVLFFFFLLRLGFQISVSCLELLWLLEENILNWVKRPKQKKKSRIKKWKHNCLQFSKQLWLRNVSVHHCQMT